VDDIKKTGRYQYILTGLFVLPKLNYCMPKEPICGNCLLFNRSEGLCNVAILMEGQKHHMPVSPRDACHMDELGIPVSQVRWWVEDPKTGEKTDKNGVVKIEYQDDFFGN